MNLVRLIDMTQTKSRSLILLAMLSPVRRSVCRLSSVTFVHFTQASETFGNVLCHLVPWPSDKNFTEIVPEEPLRLGINRRGVDKCSDFGHYQGYISETVQDRR